MLKTRQDIVFYEKPKSTLSDTITEGAAIVTATLLMVGLAWTALAIRAGALY